MEETKNKRTDKTKKSSLGGFYADFSKWDVRGKSGKELKLMVADVRNCVTHQLVRIKKLKYVINLYKENDKTQKLIHQKLKTNQQIKNRKLVLNKLRRREDKIEDLDLELEKMELAVKTRDREIAKLHREIDKKDELINEVKSLKRKVIVKSEIKPLTPEAKKLERMVENGVDNKMVNNLEYLIRSAKFLKDNHITLDYMAIILQAELLGNVKSADVNTKYVILNKLEDAGWLNSSYGLKGSAKYWYVSVKGKELIKDYKNYLSYGKSIL